MRLNKKSAPRGVQTPLQKTDITPKGPATTEQTRGVPSSRLDRFGSESSRLQRQLLGRSTNPQQRQANALQKYAGYAQDGSFSLSPSLQGQVQRGGLHNPFRVNNAPLGAKGAGGAGGASRPRSQFSGKTKLPGHAKDLEKMAKKAKTELTQTGKDAFGDVIDVKSDAFEGTVDALGDGFKDAMDLVEGKEYGQAAEQLKDLMNQELAVNDNGDTLTGENVMLSTEGLGYAGKVGTETLVKQLEFADRMQQAGIDASLPPTEDQLKDYFATMKEDPELALQEFENYCDAFHVHSGDVGGGNDDIVYNSKSDTGVPENWGDVTKDRDLPELDGKYPQHAGKSVNDCEGYSHLADTLLGAAGFDVEHVTAMAGDDDAGYDGHSMVRVTHSCMEGSTTVSNGDSFSSMSSAWNDATGLDGWGVTYYGGDTQAESVSNAMNGENVIGGSGGGGLGGGKGGGLDF